MQYVLRGAGADAGFRRVTFRSWGIGAAALLAGPLLAGLAFYRPGVAAAVIAVGVLALFSPLLATLRSRLVRPASAAVAPELMVLPTVIEAQVFFGANGAAAALGAMAIYLATVKKIRPSPPWLLLLTVALAFALPFARPFGGVSVWQSLLVPTLTLTVLWLSVARRETHSFVASIVDGVGIYLIVNVVTYAAGLVSPAASVRTGALESSGGGLRIIFPFATSLALPPAMAAIYLAAALICLERCGFWRRALRLGAAGAGIFILVAADTRASMLGAALFLVLAVASPRLLARAGVPTAVGSIAFVFVFTLVKSSLGVVVGAVLSAVPRLSRGESDSDVLTLNFRGVIWENALRYWTQSVDAVGQLVGFGVRGQQRSGASAVYGDAFAAISTDPRGASVHNSYFQQLYDAGLVGGCAFAGLLIWGVARAGRNIRTQPVLQLALPGMLAAMFAGMTEVTLAPGYGQAPVYVVVGLVMCVAVGRETPLPGPRLASRRGRAVADSRANESAWHMNSPSTADRAQASQP